jgi:hypothetical protein
MDLADIKRLALAAREFSQPVGPEKAPRSITLRVPTQHQITLAALRSGMRSMADDQAATAVLERALLLGSVVAWSGVVVGDVLPQHPQAKEALELEAGSVELLLDANPEWAATLGRALLAKMAERREVQDTAEKN